MERVRSLLAEYLPHTASEQRGFRQITAAGVFGFCVSVFVTLAGVAGRAAVWGIALTCGLGVLYSLLGFLIAHWRVSGLRRSAPSRKVRRYHRLYVSWFSLHGWGWAAMFAGLSLAFFEVTGTRWIWLAFNTAAVACAAISTANLMARSQQPAAALWHAGRITQRGRLWDDLVPTLRLPERLQLESESQPDVRRRLDASIAVLDMGRRQHETHVDLPGRAGLGQSLAQESKARLWVVGATFVIICALAMPLFLAIETALNALPSPASTVQNVALLGATPTLTPTVTMTATVTPTATLTPTPNASDSSGGGGSQSEQDSGSDGQSQQNSDDQQQGEQADGDQNSQGDSEGQEHDDGQIGVGDSGTVDDTSQHGSGGQQAEQGEGGNPDDSTGQGDEGTSGQQGEQGAPSESDNPSDSTEQGGDGAGGQQVDPSESGNSGNLSAQGDESSSEQVEPGESDSSIDSSEQGGQGDGGVGSRQGEPGDSARDSTDQGDSGDAGSQQGEPSEANQDDAGSDDQQGGAPRDQQDAVPGQAEDTSEGAQGAQLVPGSGSSTQTANEASQQVPGGDGGFSLTNVPTLRPPRDFDLPRTSENRVELDLPPLSQQPLATPSGQTAQPDGTRSAVTPQAAAPTIASPMVTQSGITQTPLAPRQYLPNWIWALLFGR